MNIKSRVWLVLIFLLLGACLAIGLSSGSWQGVDEKVVEHFAREAGRSPREPFINTDRGDLLLFMFLLAGAVGGFVAGYSYRGLFPPQLEKEIS